MAHDPPPRTSWGTTNALLDIPATLLVTPCPPWGSPDTHGPPPDPHGATPDPSWAPQTIHDSLPAASEAIPGVFWALKNPPLPLIQHLSESPDPSLGCPDPSWVPPHSHFTQLFKMHPYVAAIVLDPI